MNTAATTEQLETPAATPLEDTGGDLHDWAAINDSIDAVVNEEFDGATVEGAVEVLPEPVVPVVAAPAEAPVAVVPPAPVAPVWTPPAAPAFDQAAYDAELAARTAAEQEKLIAAYQLTADEAQQMVTEPEVVLPKLLARMHQNALKAAQESLQQVVPQVLETTTRAAKVEQEARQAFFSVNDDLAKPEYESAVLQVGAMYRQVNPNAPREQAVKVIGEMARVALGLPPKGVAAPSTEPPVTPTPFTPARGGAGASVPVAKNVWADLASDFAEE